jgi:putative transposase
MKTSRFTTQQIIGFIKQAEAGMAVSELARQNGFSPTSFYAWRAKYGGMDAEKHNPERRLIMSGDRTISIALSGQELRYLVACGFAILQHIPRDSLPTYVDLSKDEILSFSSRIRRIMDENGIDM